MAIADPSLAGSRVTPEDLEEYRRSHEFLAPCCLCAFTDGVEYQETTIGIVALGAASDPQHGTYVAHCSNQRCGYSGQCIRQIAELTNVAHMQRKVCLEAFYTAQGLRVKSYNRRGK
jgi:hypothetical protein